MDSTRLGMTFGDFYTERSYSHLVFWVWLCFIGGWIALYFGEGETSGSWLLSGLTAVIFMIAYVISCILIGPLLPLILLGFISICIEALLRIRNNRPYVKPPCRYVYSPPAPPQKRSSSGGGGWLIPLALGLWIGSSWGDDD